MPTVSILIDAPHLDQHIPSPDQHQQKNNPLRYLSDAWQAVLQHHVWQATLTLIADAEYCSERAFIMQIASEIGFSSHESVPCAAYEAQYLSHEAASLAYAYLSPCHYQLGRDHILLRALKADSRDAKDVVHLMDAIDSLWKDSKPHFCQREISYAQIDIAFENQYLWQHPQLEYLFCHGFSQSLNRPLDTWLPQHHNSTKNASSTQVSRHWQKLHNEIQMLWFNHPINLARKKDHLPEINGLWLSAAGQRRQNMPLRYTHIVSTNTAEHYWLKGFCSHHQAQYTLLEQANFTQLSHQNNRLLVIIDNTIPNPQEYLASILKQSCSELSVQWLGQHVRLQAKLQSNLLSRIWHHLKQ